VTFAKALKTADAANVRHHVSQLAKLHAVQSIRSVKTKTNNLNAA